MKFKILNRSNLDMDQVRPLLKSFLPFAKKKMGFNRPVKVIFKSDADNAVNPLGKTAFYDSAHDSVTIFTDKRHIKDILRSLSHELVHHAQNCRGDFDGHTAVGEDYFQHDNYMKEIEREAYEKGNMTFRDWEEKHKKQLQESTYYTGVPKMKRIDSRRSKLNDLLMEKYGYKYNEAHCSEGELGEAHCSEEALEEEAKPDFPDVDGDGDTEEPISKASKEKKEKEGDDEDEDKDLSKVPPQLRKHVAKSKTNEDMIREAIRQALRKA